MFIESISPVQSTFLRSNTTHFNQNGETFRDVFQRQLNSKSNSRPPKIEVTGILIPFHKVIGGRLHKYKLETDATDYTLSMSEKIERIARKIELEEVTVKGLLDLDTNILEVEKISVTQLTEPIAPSIASEDFSFVGGDDYERAIARRGKLEPSFDNLAS